MPPFQPLVDPISDGRDCAGRTAGPASPPQSCGSLELEVATVGASIDAVSAAEGPRVPAAGVAPRQASVLVLMLQSRAETWSAADCRLMARSIRERIDAFERANAGQLRLEKCSRMDVAGCFGDRVLASFVALAIWRRAALEGA